MTDVERHAELVYAETLFEKVSSKLPTSADFPEIRRLLLGLRTQETGLRSSRKRAYTSL
jgi:hypothetical protein